MLGELSVWYLFLGGCGGGLLLAASMMTLLVPLPRRALASGYAANVHELRTMHRLLARLFVPLFAASGALIAVGVACLLIDLGIPSRAFLLFASPQPTFVSVGSWLLSSALALTLAMLFLWVRDPGGLPAVARVVPAAAAAVAGGVVVYTGLLLQSISAVPLWDSPLLPCLFVASSLSCGISLAVAIVRLSGVADSFEALARRLEGADLVVLVCEALIAAAFVFAQLRASSAGDTGTAQALGLSMQALLAGPYARVFFVVFGGFGIALPLIITVFSLLSKPSPLMPFGQAACTLIGALAMRWCVVQAGVHPVLQTAGLL